MPLGSCLFSNGALASHTIALPPDGGASAIAAVHPTAMGVVPIGSSAHSATIGGKGAHLHAKKDDKVAKLGGSSIAKPVSAHDISSVGMAGVAAAVTLGYTDPTARFNPVSEIPLTIAATAAAVTTSCNGMSAEMAAAIGCCCPI